VSGVRLLAPPTANQRDALRATLLCAARLPVYAAAFGRAGLIEQQIRADPIAALARLPLFAPEMHAPLARQSLARRRHDLGGVELSSGTGGPPKRRVLSEEDVALDAAQLTRLLRLAGVRADDRVAAIELAVTPLAAAFLEGCERLGVTDSTALAWRPGADLAPLRRLAPTVLIAPPSLLEHLPTARTGLRLVIFNGDRLGRETEARLRGAGVGVRSLYGLTETSALGIGCPAEEGVHLAPEHALFDLGDLTRPQPAAPPPRPGRAPPPTPPSAPPHDTEYELIVTTLGFSMPLLRYPTGDRVRPLAGDCLCGSNWPRIEVLGRLGARFSFFEVELSVDELRDSLLDDPDAPLQVELTDAPAGRVRMTLGLPPTSRARWPAMRARLRSHPLLGYLLTTGLLQVRFRALAPVAGRKPAPLLDRRRSGEQSHAG
jgi:phenylacetate-coenzyme A ligase PaaK-like adenylate-forming protein